MSQSAASGASSRRHVKDHHDLHSSSSNRYNVDNNEWGGGGVGGGSKDTLRQRELEEARARAAQMEKTMRWWSDCTANWREKWSKVRNERNLAREEAKVLRSKLEVAIKDSSAYKHEAQELCLQNEQLKKEIESVHALLLKHAGQFDQQIIQSLENDSQLKNALSVEELIEIYKNLGKSQKTSHKNKPSTVNHQEANLSRKSSVEETSSDGNKGGEKDIEEYILQGAVPKHAVELYKEVAKCETKEPIVKDVNSCNNCNKPDKRHSTMEVESTDYLLQKVSVLHLRLDETAKTLSAEREEKNSLHRMIEKLRSESSQLKRRCEELQESREEVMKELLELKERFQVELSAAQADLLDEASSREGMDRRLSELRSELEKLQVENAAEWGKRERLETEKISLERENKQLRNELQDIQDRLECRRARPTATSETDVKSIQQELLDRNKEFVELKHAHSKLKKLFGEKSTELSHAVRRSEQYEAEVKRVRARVEELKKELSTAQDEVDAATTGVRRFQRANEDLIEQLQSANVQLEHYKNSNTETPAPDVVAEIMEDKSRDDDLDGEDLNSVLTNEDYDNSQS